MTAPWRDLAVVVLAPLAVLGLAAGMWVQAETVSLQAEAA